ncbi:MAG: peptidylprolyl isomerase [Alphaproteobacteria bacterium]|jgi:peptidylprolyl isomerase|nr:peptidylprolyl isomerase [Alphaproteobacteria bacterium]
MAAKPKATKPKKESPAKKAAPAEGAAKAAAKSGKDHLVLETTKGNVVIKFRPDLAPNHVAHIKKLAEEGFYDGIVFHRVIDGFMAQTGCPHGTGTGGSSYPNLKQEFNPEPHVRGTCSMARSSNPDSANSQFFICFDDARFLDRQYTVWGEVVEGMENVDKIKRGEPVRDPDSIVKASVVSL